MFALKVLAGEQLLLERLVQSQEYELVTILLKTSQQSAHVVYLALLTLESALNVAYLDVVLDFALQQAGLGFSALIIKLGFLFSAFAADFYLIDIAVEIALNAVIAAQFQFQASKFDYATVVAVAQAHSAHLHEHAIEFGLLDAAKFLFAAQCAEHFYPTVQFELTSAFFAAVVFQLELLLVQTVVVLVFAEIVNQQSFVQPPSLYAQLQLKLLFVLLADYSVFQVAIQKAVNVL